MSIPLTRDEKRVLTAIAFLIQDNSGMSPTQREIQKFLGEHYKSVSQITKFVASLERKGHIKKGQGWRSIEIIN